MNPDKIAAIEDLLNRIRWALDYTDLDSIRLTVGHIVGLVEEELSEVKSEAKK